MKVKVTGEAGVQYEGKSYGKGEELNVPGEQAKIWENLDLAKKVEGNSAAAKAAAKGQTVSAAKKGVGNGKGKGAAKKAANQNKTTGEVVNDTFIPTEELGK